MTCARTSQVVVAGSAEASVDGYDVSFGGHLVAGADAILAVTVSRSTTSTRTSLLSASSSSA